jgi:hypothetical protein
MVWYEQLCSRRHVARSILRERERGRERKKNQAWMDGGYLLVLLIQDWRREMILSRDDDVLGWWSLWSLWSLCVVQNVILLSLGTVSRMGCSAEQGGEGMNMRGKGRRRREGGERWRPRVQTERERDTHTHRERQRE